MEIPTVERGGALVQAAIGLNQLYVQNQPARCCAWWQWPETPAPGSLGQDDDKFQEGDDAQHNKTTLTILS